MEITTLLVLILALFTAIIIAGFQYIYDKKEKSQLNYWLFSFRFLSVFMILLLIIDPSIEKEIVKLKKPKLLVAIDNSASIKHNSQKMNVTELLSELRAHTQLNGKYEVQYYSFGESLKQLDTLSFSEKQSDLSEPFQQFSSLYKNENNPVILVTDGNQTRGGTVEFLNYKGPVFPYIIGDTAISEDLNLNRLNVNKFSYIDNKLPVELFVSYSGMSPVTKKLNVYNNGIIVYSKQLDFSKDNNVQMESFYLTSSKKGTQYYTATIENLTNELNTINNSRSFSIKVLDEQSKTLILTSILHPDLGMLKRSIESNKQRSCDIVNIADFNGELSKYNLVIIYQPNLEFKDVWKQVQADKLNYFVISGLNTDWNFLNKAQDYFQKGALEVSENFSPKFNATYGSFLNSDIGFENFSPLTDKFGEIIFKVPHHIMLFQKIGNIETEKPLLATFETNSQKTAVLFGEDIWRWRMTSFNAHKSFEYFDGFLSNLIQYLSSNLKGNRLSIDAKSMYYANETIQITASYLDKNFNFDPRAALWLTISNVESSFLKKVPFGIAGNRFLAELSNIPSGTYDYTVTVENQPIKISESFKVLDFEVEQQFRSSNKNGLIKLANATQGDVYFTNQEEALINKLSADNRFKSIQEITTSKIQLINWQWILGFILLTFSLEWFTRKYFGKI